MALIGDIIIGARELIPDLPQTLAAPTAPSASVVAAVGSTLPTGTYLVQITFTTSWGETVTSPESSGLAVAANQGIQINPSLPPSVTGVNAYLTLAGGASGTEQQLVSSPTVPFTISTPPTIQAVPPTRNTAWLPDTNGTKMFSAGTAFRWLNEGLRRLSLKVGGIQDYSAIGTVTGKPLYPITGDWKKITTIWYDGFPLGLGNQGGFFRRNTIQSSVLASAAVSIHTNQVVIEIFYQPVRTAGSSTLSGNMLITDTIASVTSLTSFQSFGPPMFALIGTEIVAFTTISGSTLTGILRGVGGTVPQAWAAGTAVSELNVPFLGKRISTTQYVPGNSANTLPLPTGWENLLVTYLVSRARDAEQDTQSATKYLKDFDDGCTELLRANRQLMGPTQVGGGMYGAETVPGFGTAFGGVVLP